ncbi:MAG: hypothetical protein OEX02_08280 [Cyclobacteriaceae bacterium]|nr:hypothetical protein [Cyclobacteriaceae bacterium]
MKKSVLLLLMMALTFGASAQCAMCKATLENNLTDGTLVIGSTLNIGILYLFFTPYLALGALAFFWYRHSKANARS